MLRMSMRWKCLSQHIHSFSAQGEGLIRDTDLSWTCSHESGQGRPMRQVAKDQKQDTLEPQYGWCRLRQKNQQGRTWKARQSRGRETSEARLETEFQGGGCGWLYWMLQSGPVRWELQRVHWVGWEVISDLCQSNFKDCESRKLTVPDWRVVGEEVRWKWSLRSLEVKELWGWDC